MKKSFGRYSEYYDLIYKGKPYKEEADFVLARLKRHQRSIKSIIELGCGSGRHAEYLSQSGIAMTGVDLSAGMVKMAKSRAATLPAALQKRLSFSIGDVRTFSAKKTFDAAISLFHVASYQTSNDDLINYLKTANKHLKKGGHFLFDFWYLPAVLHLKPSTRFKKFSDKKSEVLRIAEPAMFAPQNRVDVQYSILFRDFSRNTVEEFSETHPMRYFSDLEIDLALRSCGFKMVEVAEWMTSKDPSENSWGVYVVARKEKDCS